MELVWLSLGNVLLLSIRGSEWKSLWLEGWPCLFVAMIAIKAPADKRWQDTGTAGPCGNVDWMTGSVLLFACDLCQADYIASLSLRSLIGLGRHVEKRRQRAGQPISFLGLAPFWQIPLGKTNCSSTSIFYDSFASEIGLETNTWQRVNRNMLVFACAGVEHCTG